ncbi:prolyl oligopeptidase family serine peptidase [Planococcus sp. APC 4015]|nr:prolyl oligopeptidase family serine peptidase [Planococcus sp. APC 4015]
MTTPYGSWPSPLSAADVSAGSPRIEGARFVGGEVWWGEGVPEEGGRTAVRRRTASGTVEDVLEAPWSARSRVHEYGGGAWTTVAGDALVFVEKSDQRVWMLRAGSPAVPLTPVEGDTRFGGLVWRAGRLLAVREVHGGGVPARDLVAIPLDGSASDDPAALVSLAGGSDFVAHPSLSPDGTRLAWVAWDHPYMPWDRSAVRVGRVDGDVVVDVRTVAGGETSPLQPEWIGEDLVFADDPTGRWNLYRSDSEWKPSALAPADADTGGGIWVLGTRWYGILSDGRIVAIRTQGSDRLVVVDPASGAVDPVLSPITAGASIEDVDGTRVLVSGADVDGGPGLWLIDIDAPDAVAAVRGGATTWGPQWMPRPRAVTVDGPHGEVHAFDYPPTNPEASAPDGELPPYVVFVHGGPTAHSGPAASGKIAYLTSRGIGVLDVNYGGSTGYGRAYRERLAGQWGVVDVDDVAAAARGIAAAGIADPHRIAIAGGSAGGWTVLAAVTRTDAFAAGISRYGVGDARALAADTHDFEARYLDGLIGPLPEAEDVYIERSPLTRPELFRVPLLLLQGAEDTVVPPAQSQAVRDALATHGVPHAYVEYEGEGHGFRRAETVVHALETELGFLGAVFGFTPAGIPPVHLD